MTHSLELNISVFDPTAAVVYVFAWNWKMIDFATLSHSPTFMIDNVICFLVMRYWTFYVTIRLLYCFVTEALLSEASNNLKETIIITYMYKSYKHIIDVAQRIRNVITKNRVTSLPCFTAGLCITAFLFSWVRELLRRTREAESFYKVASNEGYSVHVQQGAGQKVSVHDRGS